MSIVVNGEFHLNETWIINGTVRDYRAAVASLSGGEVRFRLTDVGSNLVFDLTTSNSSHGQVVNAAGGTYRFVIDGPAQLSANVIPGVYTYEVKAFFANGTSSVQNRGTISVLTSLFES